MDLHGWSREKYYDCDKYLSCTANIKQMDLSDLSTRLFKTLWNNSTMR